MPDTNDQNLSNPQSLVDAALSSAPPPPPAPISAPVADDTPLAFVAPTPAPAPPPTPPVPEQQSSYLPPAPPAPINTETLKPKKKMGVVLGGILLLVLALGGGVWGYSRYSAQTSQVAKVSEAECGRIDGKDVKCPGTMVCKSGVCEAKSGGGNTSGGGDKNEPGVGEFGYKYPTSGEIAGTYKCGANNDKLCLVDSPGTLEAAAKYCSKHTTECNQLNFTEAVHAKITQAESGLIPCAAGDTGCPESCATKAGASSWTNTVKEPGGDKYCDADGRECTRYRIEKTNPAVNSWCFVNYGEQCGEAGSCGPGTNSPSPSPSPSPTMACTGITRTPATEPVTIGQVLTFTCTGSVTPATAGTLSYKYRYSIDSGAYTVMTSNTLTIAACGTYSVQCQACATIAGVLKCNPTWTGATP